MRKIVLLAAVAALAVPALAEQFLSAGTVRYGTYDLASGTVTENPAARFGPAIAWDCTTQQGFYAASTDRERLDWGDTASGLVVNGFQIGYATNSTTPVSAYVAFYSGINGGGDPLGTTITVFDLANLPGGGGWFLDVDLEGGYEFTITAPDLDGDGLGDFGYGYHFYNGGDGTSTGPLLTLPGPDPVGAPGVEDAYDRYNAPGRWAGGAFVGTYWFGGWDPTDNDPPFTQFWMRLYTVPEPAALALLALGALLRRR